MSDHKVIDTLIKKYKNLSNTHKDVSDPGSYNHDPEEYADSRESYHLAHFIYDLLKEFKSEAGLVLPPDESLDYYEWDGTDGYDDEEINAEAALRQKEDEEEAEIEMKVIKEEKKKSEKINKKVIAIDAANNDKDYLLKNTSSIKKVKELSDDTMAVIKGNVSVFRFDNKTNGMALIEDESGKMVVVFTEQTLGLNLDKTIKEGQEVIVKGRMIIVEGSNPKFLCNNCIIV